MAKQKEMEFVDLMSLATTDTSEVKGKQFQEQANGIYIINMTDARFQQLDDANGEPRAMLFHEGVVEHYEGLEDDEQARDPEQMIGKRFRQGTFVDLSDMVEAIAMIKGRLYERAKFPTAGVPGGVEGADPGWIDGVIGQRVAIRVRTKERDDGSTRTYYDWLSPKDLNKIGVDWEELQRPALSPTGEEEEAQAT